MSRTMFLSNLSDMNNLSPYMIAIWLKRNIATTTRLRYCMTRRASVEREGKVTDIELQCDISYSSLSDLPAFVSVDAF